jgi:3-hydroxyisobutyrate dehydrogenase
MNSIAENQSELGFIGIGAMGLRMAGRLLKHGFRVTVFDRSTEKASALVESGGTVAYSIAELASSVHVVLSSLPNDEVVLSVYAGPEGVMKHVRRGSMIIEMSTVSPETSRELSRLGAARGVSVLDVPVSGSTPAAEQGLLTLFCGGDEDSYNSAKAIFDAIGKQHFCLGPRLELDYRPEFAIGLMNKDFRLILETALAVQAPMPAAASSFPINNAESAEHPDYDFCAVINRM